MASTFPFRKKALDVLAQIRLLSELKQIEVDPKSNFINHMLRFCL